MFTFQISADHALTLKPANSQKKHRARTHPHADDGDEFDGGVDTGGWKVALLSLPLHDCRSLVCPRDHHLPSPDPAPHLTQNDYKPARHRSHPDHKRDRSADVEGGSEEELVWKPSTKGTGRPRRDSASPRKRQKNQKARDRYAAEQQQLQNKATIEELQVRFPLVETTTLHKLPHA
jgi:hypothetical protein